MEEGSDSVQVMLIYSEAVRYASISYSVLGKTCTQKTSQRLNMYINW